MEQEVWRLLGRKYTGTSLLLTGACALGLGWALSRYFNNGAPTGAQGHGETQVRSSYFDQDEQSEPNTPRDGSVSGRRAPRRTNTLTFDSTASAKAEYKQAILIRTDLDMVRVVLLRLQMWHQISCLIESWLSQATGKVAAQACHAAVSAVKKAWRSKDPAYKAWVGHCLVLTCQTNSLLACAKNDTSADCITGGKQFNQSLPGSKW